MGRFFFSSYICIVLVARGGLVLSKEPCSMLEFPSISENTVRSKENSHVSFHFFLNKTNCKATPDKVFIEIIKEKNVGQPNECTIRVKPGKCILAGSSTACQCNSTDNMLFLKRVTKSDEGVYVWIWSEDGTTEKERRITLVVSAADSEILTQRTDTHQPTTTFLQKDPGTGAVKSVGPNIDNGVTLIITVATCVCLVVMTAVITAGVVCCMKARRRHDQLQISPDFAFANLNGALLSRDQARDIYEEIPDPPKAHRISRVNSTSSSKSGVKLPPIPDMEQHEATATQSSLKQSKSCDLFDGYLHPADICKQLP